jgi:Ca-activated chloride channel family protein
LTGSPASFRQSGFIEMDGIRQRVPPVRPEMQEIASITGGHAYIAESSGELEDFYKDIGSSAGFGRVDKEITSRFAGIAMLLTFIAGAASIVAASRFP